MVFSDAFWFQINLYKKTQGDILKTREAQSDWSLLFGIDFAKICKVQLDRRQSKSYVSGMALLHVKVYT